MSVFQAKPGAAQRAPCGAARACGTLLFGAFCFGAGSGLSILFGKARALAQIIGADIGPLPLFAVLWGVGGYLAGNRMAAIVGGPA